MSDFYSLAAIGERLRTQDNASTELPIFVVQQRRRFFGVDEDYHDESKTGWFDDDGNQCNEIEDIAFETRFSFGGGRRLAMPGDKAKYTRRSFLYIWEYVIPFFTRVAAERYIVENAHNLKEPRIYVESGYRNGEWEAVREFLMGLSEGKS